MPRWVRTLGKLLPVPVIAGTLLWGVGRAAYAGPRQQSVWAPPGKTIHRQASERLRYDNVIDPATMKPIKFAVPLWSAIRGASFHRRRAEEIEVRFRGDLSACRSDRLVVFAFLKPEKKGLAIVLPLGSAPYKSSPQLKPGEAGVVRFSDFKLVSRLGCKVEGSKVTIQLKDKSIRSRDVTHVEAHYCAAKVARKGLGWAGYVPTSDCWFGGRPKGQWCEPPLIP